MPQNKQQNRNKKKKIEKKVKTFSFTDESTHQVSNVFKDSPAPEIKKL